MATPSGPNGGSSSSNSQGQSAASPLHSFSGKKDTSSSRHQKVISVCIQPTIGPSFVLSLAPTTRISTLKETISDRMGLSPQKMTLLLHNNALNTGTLIDNGIDDGNEVRLVPAIESGVTTTNSVDPVAMMKHSMSGISDQQIDDFLNGKFPLSVAIRVGESVVVVNLHRAKVEEIEMEPPLRKRRCVRARRPSSSSSSSSSAHDDMDCIESTLSSKHRSSLSRDSYRYLNSNPSPSDLMDVSDLSPTSHHHHHHHHHRRSSHNLGGGSKSSHRTLCKGQDMLALSRRHRKLSRDRCSHPLGPPDRSMLTYTRDISGAPMETSIAISAPPPGPMETSSHTPIPRATPIISKDAPVVTPIDSHCGTESKRSNDSHKTSIDVTSCSDEESMGILSHGGVSTTKQPGGCDATNSCGNIGSMDMDTTTTTTTTTTTSVTTTPGSFAEPCYSDNSKSKSISRSVQTDPEPSARDVEIKDHRASSLRGSSRKVVPSNNKRDVKLPESGISMKRKAVMEAISEILKKMYANTEKGRLPGSFKGRFSSEFTCDSDMREILHSKTTMTGYGSEEDLDKPGSTESDSTIALTSNAANLSKAKLQEHQHIMDKVASLKWKMQNKRALRMARRKGERSPCGWMEALNCDTPGGKPKTINRNGFCGLKRGFLLAD